MEAKIAGREALVWSGRHLDAGDVRYFDYSASGFEFCLRGTRASCVIKSDARNWDRDHLGILGVYVTEMEGASSFWDGFPEISRETPVKKIILDKDEGEYVLFEADAPKTVVVRVLKMSEAAFGMAGFRALKYEGALLARSSRETLPKIEFIGDSITCGYGIEGVWNRDTFSTATERADLSYAFLTARKLRAEFSMVSWSGIGVISNFVDASQEIPETPILMPSLWPYADKSASIRLGREPEVWDEKNFSPDVIVIHLGTNDDSFVRNDGAKKALFREAYRALVEAARRRSPRAKICCCLGAMGQNLCAVIEDALSLFKKDFPNARAEFVKFPVQSESDGIAADWHPSAATHEKMAEILSESIARLLRG